MRNTLRVVVVLGLTVAVALVMPLASGANPTTCLSASLPTAPLAPVFSTSIAGVNELGLVEIWRQPCQDTSGNMAVLMRVTPVTPTVTVCSTGAVLQQGGADLDALIGPTPTSPFCGEISEPHTFRVVQDTADVPTFKENATFRLTIPGAIDTSVLASAPFLTLVPTGCVFCEPGQTLGFVIRITNPGPAITTELKAIVRLPNGTTLATLGNHSERVLGSAQIVDVPLIPNVVLPEGLQTGFYIVQAALLTPELGLQWSRDNWRFEVR